MLHPRILESQPTLQRKLNFHLILLIKIIDRLHYIIHRPQNPLPRLVGLLYRRGLAHGEFEQRREELPHDERGLGCVGWEGGGEDGSVIFVVGEADGEGCESRWSLAHPGDEILQIRFHPRDLGGDDARVDVPGSLVAVLEFEIIDDDLEVLYVRPVSCTWSGDASGGRGGEDTLGVSLLNRAQGASMGLPVRNFGLDGLAGEAKGVEGGALLPRQVERALLGEEVLEDLLSGFDRQEAQKTESLPLWSHGKVF